MKLIQAKFVGSYPSQGLALMTTIPAIAIGGRSNVGKSSLMNSLLRKKKLAQVSKAPGKTKMLNYFLVSDQNSRELFHMVDLPGFGYARVSEETRKSWKKMVEDFIEHESQLAGFVLLADSRRGLQSEETQLLEYLQRHMRKTCLVLTKSDKLTKSETSKLLKETAILLSSMGLNDYFPILHSSKNATGNDLIWRWLTNLLGERLKGK